MSRDILCEKCHRRVDTDEVHEEVCYACHGDTMLFVDDRWEGADDPGIYISDAKLREISPMLYKRVAEMIFALRMGDMGGVNGAMLRLDDLLKK